MKKEDKTPKVTAVLLKGGRNTKTTVRIGRDGKIESHTGILVIPAKDGPTDIVAFPIVPQWLIDNLIF